MKCFSILLLLPLQVVSNHETVTVHGSGTTNPSKCYWRIMEQLMDRAKLSTRMTYRAVGSSTGQKEFIGNGTFYPDNVFGSGDIPIPTAKFGELQAANVDIVHLPVVLGAISLFHSVPNVPQGEGGLNLTGCLIARIFKREIKDWLHPDIQAINENLRTLSGTSSVPITVAHRRLGSSSTSSVTKYLRAACDTEWPQELVGSKIDWDEDTKVCEGSGGMTTCIRDTPGTIGYIDAGHGHAEGLIEIELRNANGNFLSSLEASAKGGIGAAAANANLPSSADQDFGTVELLNQPGDSTWPIVAMSYIYVRKDLSFIESEDDKALLLAFLESIYDPEYIDMCKDFGFTPVSDGVLQLGLDGIAMLDIAATPRFTFENATQTQANVGQGDYVISGKRRSYAEVERSDASGDIEALMQDNHMLQKELANMQKVLVTLEQVVATNTQNQAGGGVDNNDDETITISSNLYTSTEDSQLQAALVMSAISIVLWCIAILAMIKHFFFRK